jgi:hypothetical protein
MGTKWNPDITEKKIIEIDSKIFEQRLEELAELFYDAFCELHKTRSVEPKLISSCYEQDQRKAG